MSARQESAEISALRPELFTPYQFELTKNNINAIIHLRGNCSLVISSLAANGVESERYTTRKK